VFAHIGGSLRRHQDEHDARIERSVEVHSRLGPPSNGLIEDRSNRAIASGNRGELRTATRAPPWGKPSRRVAVSAPTAGLTCPARPDSAARGLFDAMRRRHHYATTGLPRGSSIRGSPSTVDAELFDQEPQPGRRVSRTSDRP